MKDLVEFALVHPEFCGPQCVRVPGIGALPDLNRARRFDLNPEAIATYQPRDPKDPEALSRTLRQGPEAVAFYASFRLAGDRWGIYIREGGLRALQEEYHRILWRDLGKYADRDIAEIMRRLGYSLVLDYLLTHAKFHFRVDRQAALWEHMRGTPLYAPYQARWYGPSDKALPQQPEDIGNLEESLANLEAFRLYINPTYGEAVARLVEGHLDPRNVEEWKAFFIGGRFAVEMANFLSRQPPGWKDFSKFLNRRTSVGSTNYVRIQYSYNPEMLQRGLRELARRLAGSGPPPSENPFQEGGSEALRVYLL